ncbi:MAG: glycosyltransferase [Actinomycetota bacterium]|nr:glycosyltransferase [Actinomycetota bacterium]
MWRKHSPPNLATLHASLEEALDGLRGELVVVLNGVSVRDATAPPEAQVVEFDVNHGVPVAWNHAAAAAHGEVLCFVNDDVTFGAAALRLLWRSALQRDAGVVGPVGTRWDILRARHLAYVTMEGLTPGELRPCEVVSGFLFATRRGIYQAVQGFDEAYTPCGFEEVDYCTAVRLELNLNCYAVAGVDYEHEFGVSSWAMWRRVRYNGRAESIRSISRRNRQYFLSKWSTAAKSVVGAP